MTDVFRQLRLIWLIADESFLQLRRDRIFVPVIIVGVFVSIFANLASEWGIEDFTKILFDVGSFGFHMGGSLVAIFWGTKSISDSRQQGALEVQLAAPVSRTVWFIGKYIGLLMALVLVACFLLVFWQIFMLIFQFGWMTPSQLMSLLLLAWGWLVTASIAMFFSSFCGQAVALFCALTAWIVGLISGLVADALTAQTGFITRTIVDLVARFWDLQQFNLVSEALRPGGISVEAFLITVANGALMAGIVITGACMIFRKRDLIS